MDHFQLVDGARHCEGVALAEIAAAVGTPVYVYASATMRRHAGVMRAALAPLFLALNGHELVFAGTDAVAAMLALAAGELSEDEMADWFRERLAGGGAALP